MSLPSVPNFTVGTVKPAALFGEWVWQSKVFAELKRYLTATGRGVDVYVLLTTEPGGRDGHVRFHYDSSIGVQEGDFVHRVHATDETRVGDFTVVIHLPEMYRVLEQDIRCNLSRYPSHERQPLVEIQEAIAAAHADGELETWIEAEMDDDHCHSTLVLKRYIPETRLEMDAIVAAQMRRIRDIMTPSLD